MIQYHSFDVKKHRDFLMKNRDNLTKIPGVGPSIAQDLKNIGINKVEDLISKNPEELYHLSNQFKGQNQDKCLLYVFRCAIYYANTKEKDREQEKLKWWNWKDRK